MSVPKNKKKDTRVEFRIPAAIKELIERAASLRGLTLSAYATAALVEDATRVMESAERIRLNHKDRDALLAVLRQAEPG